MSGRFFGRNQVDKLTRGPVADPVMKADYSFNAAGLLSSVVYGNLTATVYAYDNAQRVTMIEHTRIAGAVTLLKLVYTYTANWLVIVLSDDALAALLSPTMLAPFAASRAIVEQTQERIQSTSQPPHSPNIHATVPLPAGTAPVA